MVKGKTTIDFWKNWWDERAKPDRPDREIDRGSALSIQALEHIQMQKLLEAINPQKSDFLLDAGCGTGANFPIISGFVRQIIGIDISEEQLKRAERNIVREKLKNITLRVGSITKIDFPRNTFDKVICASVLQYLNNEECREAIIEMIRVCKDRGTIVIHAKNRTSLYGFVRGIIKVLNSLVGRNRLPDYYRPRRWYKKLLEAHGGIIENYDSFGILCFPLLPPTIVNRLLLLELYMLKIRVFKSYGVNYKMTVRVDKQDFLRKE